MGRTIEQAMAGQVRSRILAEHTVLRGTLDELDALLDALGRSEANVASRLRLRGAEFYDAFVRHLDVEDALLVPALRTAEDGDGMARRLAREHREQRDLIRALLDQIRDDAEPVDEIATELRSFVNAVRIDMEHEEVTILREDWLAEAAR